MVELIYYVISSIALHVMKTWNSEFLPFLPNYKLKKYLFKSYLFVCQALSLQTEIKVLQICEQLLLDGCCGKCMFYDFGKCQRTHTVLVN